MQKKLFALASAIANDTRSLTTGLLVGVLSFAVYAFLEIADEVGEGEWQAIDRELFLAFRDAGDTAVTLGPAWVQEAAIEFTALGGIPVIVLITLLVCGGLLAARLPGHALFVFVSVSGGALLSTGLKTVYARPRPDLVDHLDITHTASFPSGHATISTLTYLTLGALLAQIVPRRGFRIFVLAAAVFLAILIGVTRIYLGVHWPTDVAAGWALGTAWASLSFIVLTLLQMKRGRGALKTRNPA